MKSSSPHLKASLNEVNFSKGIDEIMDDVRSKHSDIEINYRKIPIDDRQMSEDECKYVNIKNS